MTSLRAGDLQCLRVDYLHMAAFTYAHLLIEFICVHLLYHAERILQRHHQLIVSAMAFVGLAVNQP